MRGYETSNMKHYEPLVHPYHGFGTLGVQPAQHFYFSSANLMGKAVCNPIPYTAPPDTNKLRFPSSGVAPITKIIEEDEPPPPGLTTPPMSPKPGGLDEDGIPRELGEMQKPDSCKLCSVLFSCNLKGQMHYASRGHKRKVKQFTIDYCQKHRLSLPEQFWVKPVVQKVAVPSMRCRICQVSFADNVEADKHFSGICHDRRLDGLPPLRTGFYNKLSGKWQKKPPTAHNLRKKIWWKPVNTYRDDVVEIGSAGQRKVLK
ncbi:unnamed protein product [Notodromas monacha]|uniref:U1-type domain-containing protein n=1 Tax=Notodromas monacha TaxID=399045 RepID=A0A7R9BHZ8_9CRUS|nr:unnamed protein product [Notodromas monacha]CAG0915844.1 unnamed protein product [Notodromas monacha]